MHNLINNVNNRMCYVLQFETYLIKGLDMKNTDKYLGSAEEAADQAIHDPDPTLEERKWREQMEEIYAEIETRKDKNFDDYIDESKRCEDRNEKIFIAEYGGWFYKGKFTPEYPND